MTRGEIGSGTEISVRGWFPLACPRRLSPLVSFQPSPPDVHLVRGSPPAPGDVTRSTGLTSGGLGGVIWRLSHKKTGQIGLESLVSSESVAQDFVSASRQPVAPSPDPASPLAPHAVVPGSCRRRAAAVRNAWRRAQGTGAAFWSAVAVLAASRATRACIRERHPCYGLPANTLKNRKRGD